MEDVIKRWPGKPAEPGSFPGRGSWTEICLKMAGELVGCLSLWDKWLKMVQCYFFNPK